ncbi:DUF6463 family protein [Mycobacterium sp. NPDC003449]
MNNGNITAWGGRVAVVGAIFHVLKAADSRRSAWAQIHRDGWIDTLTLRPRPDQLAASEAFWFSPGSFGVPFGLLGALILRLTRNGQRVPAWLGWAIVVWGGLIAVVLPRSGAWPIMTVGALIVLGDRQGAPGQQASSTRAIASFSLAETHSR